MANPQLEEGHLRIANGVMEALCRLRIPGEARQILDCIIRKTWGFQKKEDAISLEQFCLATGLKKDKVIRARKRLLEMRLISVSQKGNAGITIYSFNKDLDSWKPFPKKETISQKGNRKELSAEEVDEKHSIDSFPKKETAQKAFPKMEMIISKKGYESFPKKEPTKEKKETIQKKLFSSDSLEFRLAKLLLNLIRERKADFKEPNLQTWCRHIDLLIRQDRRKAIEIEETIRACQKDTFWQNNILSPGKLREKYDQLRLKLCSPFPHSSGDFSALRETVGGAL